MQSAEKVCAKYFASNVHTRVWKSRKKVSFNIASEASYVYKKFIKMPKTVILETWSIGQTVLPDRSNKIGKNVEKCQNTNLTL